MTTTTSTPASREPLTRQRVVSAAIELVNAQGMRRLSMRRLAQQLGFEPMSLYNHVANKGDLIEGMVEAVASEIELPAHDAEWKDGTRALADSTREALLRHPWVVDLWTNTFPGPERFRRMERLLELLAAADLPEHVSDLGFHSINTHVNGYARQVVGYRSLDPDAEVRDRFDREVSVDAFPLLVDHVRYHDAVDAGRQRHPDEFGYVLGLILDGLER